MTSTPVTIEEIVASATYDLRRRILRDSQPDANVTFPEDDLPGTVHLGMVAGGRVVGISTWSPIECPDEPGPAVRLRGMAVDDGARGVGVGTRLLAAGIEWSRRQGAHVVWANARDRALEFYLQRGFTVVGDGFTTADTGLPHHRVVLHLEPGR